MNRTGVNRTIPLCLLAALLISRAGAEPLLGAGATFPFPLYEKWFATFQKKFSDIPVTYRPIGSGAGIEALAKK